MIRRQVDDQFWLIEQHDHALLAGELARSWGGEFARPNPWESAYFGTAMHDCGWHAFDRRPRLGRDSLPMDVFETPREIHLPAWSESSRLTAVRDPYAGMLVAMHVLALSMLSVSSSQPGRFDSQQLRQQFDLNKFQHLQFELIEWMRKKLSLRVDRPLRMGLAEGWSDPAEEDLKYNFRVLQALDKISLAFCCTTIPDANPTPVHKAPGDTPIKLTLTRPDPVTLDISPWPFVPQKITLNLRYRAIPALPLENDIEFQSLYASTPQKIQQMTLKPG